MLGIIAVCRSFKTPYAQVSFGAEARGYMLGPWTSDAVFEALTRVFEAPLEDASAWGFEFMNLRISVCQRSIFVGGARN